GGEARAGRQWGGRSPGRASRGRCAESSNILPRGPAHHAWRIASRYRSARSPDLAREIVTHGAGRAAADVIAEHSRSILGVPPAQGRTYFAASVGGRRSSSRANTIAVRLCRGKIASRRATAPHNATGAGGRSTPPFPP